MDRGFDIKSLDVKYANVWLLSSTFPICKAHNKARLNDLVSFGTLCVMVVFYFCQKFNKIKFSTQSLTHFQWYVSAKKAPNFFVLLPPIWDLDLIPLMFLAVWPSVPVLAKFLLSVAHKFHIGGFHWSEALTSFPPATSQPALEPKGSPGVILGSSPHNSTTSTSLGRREEHLNLRPSLDVLGISTTCCILTAVDVKFALVFWGDSILCVTPNYTSISKSCAAVKIECNYLEARRAVCVCDNLTGDCPTLPISKSPVAVDLCKPQQFYPTWHPTLTCILPLPEASPQPAISQPPILNTSLPYRNIVM